MPDDELIMPAPNGTATGVLNGLNWFADSLTNLRGAGGTAHDTLNEYLRVVAEANRLLRGQLTSIDMSRLVTTPNYWAMLTGQPSAPNIFPMIHNEIDNSLHVLRPILQSVADAHTRWNTWTQRLVVPDSSAFINMPTKLREWDLKAALGESSETSVRLLVPMVVVDELDRLKEHGNDHVRWRAGHSLGVLTEHVGPQMIGEITHASAATTTIEVLVDRLGHSRLPDEDDEIIAQATGISRIAEGDVTLITSDTGMVLRGRRFGLQVHPIKPFRSSALDTNPSSES